MLNEDLIERRVERMTDSIDRRYMAGSIDEKTYKSEMADLSKWADAKFAEIARTLRNGRAE